MHRRTFCKSAVAAAVAGTLPGCSSEKREVDVGSRIAAISREGNELSIETAAVNELADSLQGSLFLQADEGYATAKQVWNGMFDHKQPAIVVQCVTVDDVVNAVTFARERDLLLSVKCGGHSLPGKSTSDGGMMIDLSQMHSVDVDADAMTLRADGGSLLGHIDTAASAHEMMTTTGIVSHTGAGGFTLGGGFGRTDRKMGLAIDNLLAATVVTAAGDVVRASEDENPDLFWGLRGGGGNFGIATEFVYRLHPFNPVVYGGTLFYKFDKDFLDFYAELQATVPDEANIEPNFVPGEDGKTIAMVEVVWCGDHAAGEKALAPMLAHPGLVNGDLGPFPYREIQTSVDGLLGHGKQYYLKSSFLKELTPDAIDVIVEFANRGTVGSWFQHLGGATSRVAADATAYAHRDVALNFGIMYFSEDPTQNEARIAAVREYYKAMEPHMAGFYTNLNEDDEKRTWGNYGENYPRLVALKNEYDPMNLFRLNANIKPGI
ncbi:MAG: FAD-binding oxidoreductase [Gammaproteobacteria bacterium]|nr:FAD-binding oxidoreductase [Gammaproteobacteria bacterium]MDH3428533.1 FAD-binding oxidoreductase [Gammaproteobacteria bacterium]MDH3433578.1 FAD-binding oxidoreductase [Gammaproteobacteria bacterium]